MLGLTFTFLIIVIIAAIFGFGGFAGMAAWVGKILSIFFLIAFIISLQFSHRWT